MSYVICDDEENRKIVRTINEDEYLKLDPSIQWVVYSIGEPDNFGWWWEIPEHDDPENPGEKIPRSYKLVKDMTPEDYDIGKKLRKYEL